MTHARWAILGAGAISANFAAGLHSSKLGRLHAVGARDVGRAAEFAAAHDAEIAGTYDEVLARPDVDAVYVGTVHTTHVDLVLAALAAGKAVLCEKPLGIDPAETEAALRAARAAGLPLVEAFKYRFGPFADRLRGVVASGELGEVVAVESTLGFAAAERAGRLFDPATAGGAILDVGCYPVSLALGVATWAGRDVASARVTTASGTIGRTGVDETASAEIDVDGITARIRTAIVEDMPRVARIVGSSATLEIANVWGTRAESTGSAILSRVGGAASRLDVPTVQPMAAEADAVIRALREGRTEVPEMSWRETREGARILADWRGALG